MTFRRGAPRQLPSELGAPLHVLLSGHRDEHDRRLAIAQAPSFGLVGKETPLTVAGRGPAGAAGRQDGTGAAARA